MKTKTIELIKELSANVDPCIRDDYEEALRKLVEADPTYFERLEETFRNLYMLTGGKTPAFLKTDDSKRKGRRR